MSNSIPVVFVDVTEFAETVGTTEEIAAKWLANEDNLGKIREALYPNSESYYDALNEAWADEV